MQAEQQSERERFEADAGPYGFDLTRCELSLSGEPWTEYRDSGTGHRWAGWLAARNPHQVPAALSHQSTPQPLSSYALQLLVAAGHITQQKADEAMHLARETLFPLQNKEARDEMPELPGGNQSNRDARAAASA